jgi:hypothetical protein
MKAKLAKEQAKAEKDLKKADGIRVDIKKIQLEIPNLEKRAADAADKVKPAEDEMERMILGTSGEREALLGRLREARAELAPWEKQTIDVKSRMEVSQSEIDMLAKSSRQPSPSTRRHVRRSGGQGDGRAQVCRGLRDAEDVGRLKNEVRAASEEEAAAIADAKRTEAEAQGASRQGGAEEVGCLAAGLSQCRDVRAGQSSR